MPNTQIIISVVGIGGLAFIRAVVLHRPLSPIVVGSYILLLILSLVDMFGGAFSDIAGGIALLALVYNMLNAVDIWDMVLGITGAKINTSTGGGHPTYR